MIIRITKLFIFLFAVSSCSILNKGKSTQAETDKVLFSVIDSIYKANPNSVGIMVSVISPDKNISWTGATGYSDSQAKTPIKSDQPVLIASNIKTYISVSILRLAEQGKININQSIGELLTQKTKELLSNDGYDLKSIKVKNLLSHTSGIMDYVDDDYFDFVDKNRRYRWSRDEQIERAAKVGKPLGKPGDTFSYADVNFLLLTEIIEQLTGEVFNKSIANLIGFKQHKLNSTWFVTLDKKPINTKPLAHQYYGKLNWDSYDFDPSWDLYGGGGIATTTFDIARFLHLVFENKIIKNKDVLNLIYTKIKTNDNKDSNYLLGLSKGEILGLTSFGHGGFWGTIVNYYPRINTTISVFVLNRDYKKLRKEIQKAILKKIK